MLHCVNQTGKNIVCLGTAQLPQGVASALGAWSRFLAHLCLLPSLCLRPWPVLWLPQNNFPMHLITFWGWGYCCLAVWRAAGSMCLWGAIIHPGAWCPLHRCFMLSPGLPFQHSGFQELWHCSLHRVPWAVSPVLAVLQDAEATDKHAPALCTLQYFFSALIAKYPWFIIFSPSIKIQDTSLQPAFTPRVPWERFVSGN